ncbi:MAG: hypothetical protein M1829_005503 [Trizodia sp. TS-e1964]|nr:MAG: hypothetical protein M1829_005503 [Trizodia sp. TS-e1964]
MLASTLLALLSASVAVASPLCPAPVDQSRSACQPRPPTSSLRFPFTIRALGGPSSPTLPVGPRINSVNSDIELGSEATYQLYEGRLAIINPPAQFANGILNVVGFSPLRVFPQRVSVRPGNFEDYIRTRAVFECDGDRLRIILEPDTGHDVGYSVIGFFPGQQLLLEPKGPSPSIRLKLEAIPRAIDNSGVNTEL